MSESNNTGVSLVTNASARDAARLRAIIPHWFRVLGKEVEEMVVILDRRPPEGRIAKQQATADSLDEVVTILDGFARTYAKFRWRSLDYSTVLAVSRLWWRSGCPVRCQDGTPVFAFAACASAARCRYILRVDCDMLLLERGWLAEAVRILRSNEADIVSPPRLGRSESRFSSRAAMVDWPVFSTRVLPMRAARLGLLRRIHRWLHGRPTFLAFEDSILEAIQRGDIRHLILPERFGCSLHVAEASAPAEDGFSAVLCRWEAGMLPKLQTDRGWNYERRAWLEA